MGAQEVTDVNQVRLRCELVNNYEDLVRNLTRRLGSSDFAYEALHETFLRLDRVVDVVAVRSPADYIFRIAVNVAKDRRKAQNHRVSAASIDAVLDIFDDKADPARVVEARSEIEALKRALAELPRRPREVLHSISIEGQAVREVAARLDVSIRTVEGDLKMALRHCSDRLDHKLIHRLGGRRLRL